MLLAHHPELVTSLREPSPAEPWRVLVSACLAGELCGVDGGDNGGPRMLGDLLSLPALRPVPFCPERYRMGVPRTMPDLHGGDGFAVLAGRARVLDERGRDLTEAMLEGARAMVALAQEQRVDLAILMDMSAACGSQVISDGCRFDEPRRYQVGVGVASAALLSAGIPVVSQRDRRTLAALRARLDPAFVPPDDLRDHHESDWYMSAFGAPR